MRVDDPRRARERRIVTVAKQVVEPMECVVPGDAVPLEPFPGLEAIDRINRFVSEDAVG